MGWKNMFEEFDKANKKAPKKAKPASQYSGLFGAEKQAEPNSVNSKLVQTAKWDAFGKTAEPTKQEVKKVAKPTDWGKLTEVLLTPFEQNVRLIQVDANVPLVKKWTEKWDMMFEHMADRSQELSHTMLNLTQDLSRVHESQAHMFTVIQDGIREADQAFNPTQPEGFMSWLYSNEAKPLTNDEVNEVVDKVQAELSQLTVKIDPFITNGLVALRADVKEQLKELTSANIALEYQMKFSKCEQEFYDRQVIRLHNMNTMLTLSDSGVTQLDKQIQSRTAQLSDFKLQAVPMVVIKLQQYIINKDVTELKGAFVDILEMKLE